MVQLGPAARSMPLDVDIDPARQELTIGPLIPRRFSAEVDKVDSPTRAGAPARAYAHVHTLPRRTPPGWTQQILAENPQFKEPGSRDELLPDNITAPKCQEHMVNIDEEPCFPWAGTCLYSDSLLCRSDA